MGDFPLCRLLLMNDSHYPWFILVPKVAGAREIYELPQEQQIQVLAESSLLAKVLMEHFRGEKLNLAALGNMVPQLHIHHVVRYCDDAAWPGPIWGVVKPEPYAEMALAEIRKSINSLLAEQSIKYFPVE